MKFKVTILIVSLAYLLLNFQLICDNTQIDTNTKKKELLKEAEVRSAQMEIELTIRSVDISKFPIIKIFVEAYNKLGQPLDTLKAENIIVYEKGIPKSVISVEKIPTTEEIMVDFIFAIDITGSMQKYINYVQRHTASFTNSLVKRGIDYRLGLILFTDDIEKIYQPTKSVTEFLGWLEVVRAQGGGDEKENALEALEEAALNIKYRQGANRVVVLITDAPYHQKGEDGDGVTNQTTESIIDLLINNEIRVFSITPPRLENYKLISRKTRGNYFDIEYPFSTILDNFSQQLTNLYYITYNSEYKSIPDSIDIAVFNEATGKLIRKTIPIVELGRKLIIENLLFETNKADLPEKVPALDILADFMNNRTNIKLLIEGHTDNIGTHQLNDRLSQMRAESVKNYLIKKGIPAERLRTIGYGKRRPIASNNSEFGRQLNRRTEIVILDR